MLPAGLQLRNQGLVDRRPRELDDLVAQVHVGRRAPDERVRRLGAPPVELLATLAPVAPLPLAQRRRDMAVIVGVLVQPERKLPADVRLPVERSFAVLERGDVERAADAALEAGAVQEDAGAVDHTCRAGALVVGGEPVLLALAPQLPRGRGQAAHGDLDRRHVIVVDEVRAVAAAALVEVLRRPRQHAPAAVTEDARPVRRQEGHVEHPSSVLARILERDPLVQILGDGVLGSLRHRRDDSAATERRVRSVR